MGDRTRRVLETLRENPFVCWLARFWFAQHNARVIEDFERRMSLVIENATDGRMSKPYYTIAAMQVEIDASRSAAYDDGYNDALDEHDIEREPLP